MSVEKYDATCDLTQYRCVPPLGPYRLLHPIRDSQVGKAFVGARSGPDGFEKRVVIRCTKRALLDPVVAEAKRAAHASHAGIAHVLDAGAFEDVCYVVSEYVPGTTLQALLIRHGPLPWRSAARVIADAANALGCTHGRRDETGKLLGLVHRRITPRRLTLSASGNTTITGLGASWAWPDHQGFGAPEETRGEPIDGRADVFSLGLVLRRCIGGADISAELRELIELATHPLPEHRCTAAALHEALAHVLREAGPPPTLRDVAALTLSSHR